MADSLNYAQSYEQTLAQAFPYTLNFGALYASSNNQRYRCKGGQTIELPVITTSGRTDADRDSIGSYGRAYENAWEEKTLSHHRCWSTLIHPMDVDQTDYAATIRNITRVFNDEQKFPEMDAYTVSALYEQWIDADQTPTRVTLSSANLLSTFDSLMEAMSEARVPVQGRVLYVTPSVMTILKSVSGLTRSLDVKQGDGSAINRTVTMLDGVQVVEVPAALMKTAYDFTSGWEADDDAEQISMLLIHPDAVVTPVSYQFSRIDPPTALTGGKYLYYEESAEDVFLLEERIGGIAFVLPELEDEDDEEEENGNSANL